CRSILTQQRIRPQVAWRIHSDDAAVEISLLITGSFFSPQDSRGTSRRADRAPLHQGANLHAVCEPELSRPRSVWVRSRFGVLLQQAGPAAQVRRSRAAGGIAEVADLLLSHQSS